MTVAGDQNDVAARTMNGNLANPQLPEQSAWRLRWQMLMATLRPVRSIWDKDFRSPSLADRAYVESKIKAFRDLPAFDADTKLAIPKRIFMLWHQGWEDAPPLVRACADSWRHHNPDWELVLLDANSLPDFAPGYAEKVPAHLSPQHRADLARTMLLAQHGGVWADATLLCLRPLDQWLPVAAQSGFFMFVLPRPYRPVDNWFLAAGKGNRVIDGMHDLFFQYWRHFKRPHHYFWMIYLIEHLFNIDAEAAQVWAQTPRLSASVPLLLHDHALDKDPPQWVRQMLEENLIPMAKLNRRLNSDDLGGTLLQELTGLTAVERIGK